VIAKTIYVPLPKWMLSLVRLTDRVLTWAMPQLLAMQRQIVLEKCPVETPADSSAVNAPRRTGRLLSPAA
jgi:hypothetical protein